MKDAEDISDILALLDWYRSVGVDACLDAEPINWLQRPDAPPGSGFQWPGRSDDDARTRSAIAGSSAPGRASPGPLSQGSPSQGLGQSQAPSSPAAAPPARAELRNRPQTPLAASEAETEARRAARNADSIGALGERLAAFDGCTLKATASKLCFYRGAETARLMIIGEAPGRDEDLAGKPFVGRAGQLLDKMLKAIGLDEGDVHITNVVYWRPPGNRTPTPQEALACRPFLERQIELVGPQFILTLGGSAAKEVLGVSEGIMRLRGKWREVPVGGKSIPALATLHPAYLLRTPAAKQLAWRDLLAIKAKLDAG